MMIITQPHNHTTYTPTHILERESSEEREEEMGIKEKKRCPYKRDLLKLKIVADKSCGYK